MNKIRKTIVATAILGLALMPLTTQSQIFLTDMEDSYRTQNEDFEVIFPLHGVEWDQTNHTPLGGGTLLLASLGIAYLVAGKSKKKR